MKKMEINKKQKKFPTDGKTTNGYGKTILGKTIKSSALCSSQSSRRS
jgi:hypothetical protein